MSHVFSFLHCSYIVCFYFSARNCNYGIFFFLFCEKCKRAMRQTREALQSLFLIQICKQKFKKDISKLTKKWVFVLMRIFSLQQYVSMALKYVLMEFINFQNAKRIFFLIGWLYRARTTRKNRDIRRRHNVFLSPAQAYPMEYRQIHARIRETSELLNTSNAKEQLAFERRRRKEYPAVRFRIERLRLNFARKFGISYYLVHELISLVW